MLALAALVLAAPTGAASTPGRAIAAAAPPRIALAVSSAQQPRPRGGFSASRVLDLQFDAVFLRPFAGDHLLELKLYTPKGHLYQVLSVPFTATTPSPRPGRPPLAYRHVEGYPQPLVVQSMARMPGRVPGYRVSAHLPVAGTWIINHSLYGSWKVAAHLDGSRAPLAQRSFALQQ